MSESGKHHFHMKVVSVAGLLAENKLRLPVYQRPYKWTSENVNHLFSDIAIFSGKKAYRLGTVVFHRDKDGLDIVDGQQRTITLLITVLAIIKHRLDSIKGHDLRDTLTGLRELLEAKAEELVFPSEISRVNINNNYLEISLLVSRPEFTEDLIHFLLHQCEVVTFVLDDVSEAFQFFDSQNARGRDLSPHDLLKAYHLREFTEEDESLKIKTVSRWEETDPEDLADLFAEKLFRIRNWSKGVSARYFTKEDIDLFKGVSLSKIGRYPYTDSIRITHHFVDHHRGQYERFIDDRSVPYPFQLDQIILNGRRFFEMVDHYLEKISSLSRSESGILGSSAIGARAMDILDAIDTYGGRNRTGDRYVRSLFDCLLIYYIDKFGSVEISQAIEKIFIWSYSIRLKMNSVQLATVDNSVVDETNLFVLLRDAIRPSDFNLVVLSPVGAVRSSNTAGIENIFREMKYLKP